MLTLKLRRGHSIKIVEAAEIEIFPCGRAEGSDNDPSVRTNQVREIFVKDNPEAFYIANDADQMAASHGEGAYFWHVAYIENSHGATTETVRPY